ncbi:hypothetical protein [Streptomyces sp. NPDC046939]|uniref:hypothetical protein n=1 Tax=Streptomyces sp. NPDC046939 TaxID=3155376 RepID=UPI0033C89199
MLSEAIKKLLGNVKPGDYVTAVGVDTRGAEVKRVGTLLAPPKPVKGKGGEGARLCIGLKGTDPEQRSTWALLYESNGSVKRIKPPVPGEDWTNGPLKDIPGMRVDAPMHILYGGKGGKRATQEPTNGERAEIVHVGEGRYEVRSLASGKALFSGAWGAQLWWSPAAENGEPYIEDQDQDQDQEHERQEQNEPQDQTATEHRYGKAVYHVRTGQVVGYLTPLKFTPIGDVE